jgi:hypothetical protein
MDFTVIHYRFYKVNEIYGSVVTVAACTMALPTGLQDGEKAAKEGGAEPLHNILYTDIFFM